MVEVSLILALVEQAQQHVDVAKAEKLASKISKGGFDLEDFRDQLMQMQKMGGMASLMDKLPSQMAQAASKTNLSNADKQTTRMRLLVLVQSPDAKNVLVRVLLNRVQIHKPDCRLIARESNLLKSWRF